MNTFCALSKTYIIPMRKLYKLDPGLLLSLSIRPMAIVAAAGLINKK